MIDIIILIAIAVGFGSLVYYSIRRERKLLLAMRGEREANRALARIRKDIENAYNQAKEAERISRKAMEQYQEQVKKNVQLKMLHQQEIAENQFIIHDLEQKLKDERAASKKS